MDGIRAPLSRRIRRALALIGLALVGMAVAVGAYLRSQPLSTAPAARPAPPVEPAVLSVDWLSPLRGWVVLGDPSSGRSVLFRTADAGRHWERQFATVGPVTVDFADAGHGLLHELSPPPNAPPAVLRSDDGGAHWSPLSLPGAEGWSAGSPVFVDSLHGWVLVTSPAGDAERQLALYRTADGAVTWTELVRVVAGGPSSHGLRSDGHDVAMSFRNPFDGWLDAVQSDGSVAVYVTHDGGQEWRRTSLPQPPNWVPGERALVTSPAQVAADGRGQLVASLGNGSGARAGGPLAVYATADGGDTWLDPQPVPAVSPAAAPVADFADGRAGWVAAGPDLWVSPDSGRTWSPRGRLAPGWSFLRVAAVDASVAVAEVTNDGVWRLLQTEDGGQTWRVLSPPSMT